MQILSFEQLPAAVANLQEKVDNIVRLLTQNKLASAGNHEEGDILTVDEAASFLRLSVPTVYGLVSKRLIPVSKRGKRLYFSRQELTDWVLAEKKKTKRQIEEEASQYFANKKKGR